MASSCDSGLSRHQLLYKSKTPPWKETYRNRCRERLRKGRQALFESFRSSGGACHSEQELRYSVTKVVREELDNFCCSSATSSLGLVASSAENAVPAAPWDEARLNEELMEETLAALLEEEFNVWKQYEDIMALQNQEIAAAVHMWSSELVACPVCLKNDLEKDGSRIICACGLAIPTALSLKEFRLSIERVVEAHCLQCRSFLSFTFIETCEPALVCVCNACDFMSSVL
ncbi:RPA-interacting protein B-like [Amblyomma americanum]|uniref:RPA-interacting protein n=1 Tax=Amblyomma americanum TaxID=6943 RepID=A0A0C9RTY7_AMBAM